MDHYISFANLACTLDPPMLGDGFVFRNDIAFRNQSAASVDLRLFQNILEVM
jgi:hypothetical protein